MTRSSLPGVAGTLVVPMGVSEANLGGLPIAAGDVLLKKYRVERLIGEGGTGIVLSATHVQLEQRVAIKFLRRALESDELRTRFEREARAMGKIESDHVVLVLDAGALDDGAPYMVMEYLEGRDLARVLKEDGPLPVEDAVDCMLQVCEALQQAHAAGVVHRDLKPANLFLTRRDDDDAVHVKVVDFGISKILDKKLIDDESPHEVTTAFTMLGSPRYMAPEQVKSSKDVDGRADLWSVGAVLFQLITGEHAFAAEGNVQASLAVLTAEPRRLRAHAPHAPEGLEAVVSRCLTRDVAARFQSASDLADALRPFASERARESLDRLESAKAVPCLRVALSVVDVAAAAAGAPPERDAVAPGRASPPSRGSGSAAASTAPAELPRAPPAPRRSQRASRVVLAIGGVSSLALVSASSRRGRSCRPTVGRRPRDVSVGRGAGRPSGALRPRRRPRLRFA
ncbi:MAG: serine/threonine protein kinase [Labilithrix sp.]|nr:serine/threonine protein kinase [Labilithrix sp.]